MDNNIVKFYKYTDSYAYDASLNDLNFKNLIDKDIGNWQTPDTTYENSK